MWNNKSNLIALIEWIKETFKYSINVQTINTLLRTVQNTLFITHRAYTELKDEALSLAVAAEYIVPRESDITQERKDKIYRIYKDDGGRVRNDLLIFMRYLTDTYPEIDGTVMREYIQNETTLTYHTYYTTKRIFVLYTMREAYGVQDEEEDDDIVYRTIVNGYETEQNNSNFIISY